MKNPGTVLIAIYSYLHITLISLIAILQGLANLIYIAKCKHM